MKKVAIMQPYFLPYIGYFQLIGAVDQFVVYDNIQFTKKGWMHRNRMLQTNGVDVYFSLPLRKDSDYLNVNERYLSEDWIKTECSKTLRKIIENYRKAPFFNENFPLIETIFNFTGINLFDFNFNSITTICNFLDIKTPIIISSKIDIDHSLKAQEKVIALVNELEANHYVNPIGGIEIYQKSEFLRNNLQLSFLRSKLPSYNQNIHTFISGLSILDVLMFNCKSTIVCWLTEFEIINE